MTLTSNSFIKVMAILHLRKLLTILFTNPTKVTHSLNAALMNHKHSDDALKDFESRIIIATQCAEFAFVWGVRTKMCSGCDMNHSTSIIFVSIHN